METRIKYRDENNELQYIPYAVVSKTTYNVEKHDDWEEEGLHDYIAYEGKPDFYCGVNHPNFDDCSYHRCIWLRRAEACCLFSK